MTLQAEDILAHRFDEIRQSYAPRDAILYALGVGLGADPLDTDELGYLLETNLRVLPSFAITLASPGMWIRDPRFGVTFSKLVHSAQATAFFNELPPSASVRTTPRIVSLRDRGPGKGAVLDIERTIEDQKTGLAYCTTRQTLLLRADGGFGGEAPDKDAAPRPPDRAADHIVEFKTSSRAALIYRLSGDLNPLHADPEFARKAGFDRPILHGLASYGAAAFVLAKTIGGRLSSLQCRFSGIVFPGDTLEFHIWNLEDRVVFLANSGARAVLDRGLAKFGD